LRQNSGAAIWIFDFQRLRDPSALKALVPCVDPSMPPILLKDALASEAAGFTEAELSAELTAAGLGELSYGYARPLPYLQARWVPAKDVGMDGHAGSREIRLPGQARRDAALLRWGFTAKPF
jgi:hypothetical protein